MVLLFYFVLTSLKTNEMLKSEGSELCYFERDEKRAHVKENKFVLLL